MPLRVNHADRHFGPDRSPDNHGAHPGTIAGADFKQSDSCSEFGGADQQPNRIADCGSHGGQRSSPINRLDDG